jgi:hypothetical protein
MQQINTVVGGQEALIVLPDDFSAARTYYLIVWSHGMGDDEQGMLGYSDVINAMLPLGYLFAGTSAHGDNWGNDAALADYANLIAYMRANYNITFVGFWGGSMGGLTGLLSIARGEIAGVKGAFLGLPVCNLGSMYNDLDWADPSINAAYNIPGGGSYATQTAGHDPILRPVNEYAGKRFRFTASPEDTLVLKSTNADAFSAYISSVALEYEVLTIHGEHGVEHGMTPAEVVPFFERCCRVLDSITLSTGITLHAPLILRESAFEVPRLTISTALYAPSVTEGQFITPALSVAVEAHIPRMQTIATPIARHGRQMAVRRTA